LNIKQASLKDWDLLNATAVPLKPARYRWVNPIQIWASGTVDLAKGEIRVKGYAA
jgi:hypothetical protein